MILKCTFLVGLYVISEISDGPVKTWFSNLETIRILRKFKFKRCKIETACNSYNSPSPQKKKKKFVQLKIKIKISFTTMKFLYFIMHKIKNMDVFCVFIAKVCQHTWTFDLWIVKYIFFFSTRVLKRDYFTCT